MNGNKEKGMTRKETDERENILRLIKTIESDSGAKGLITARKR